MHPKLIQFLSASKNPLAQLRANRYGLVNMGLAKPCLELYYRVGDPHSHLCAQLIPALKQLLKCDIAIRLVDSGDESLNPEQTLQAKFALQDAKRIAPAWGLHFAEHWQIPATEQVRRAECILASCISTEQFLAEEASLAARLFDPAGNDLVASNKKEQAASQRVIQANNQRQAALGHYGSAMWQFGGEWFWALDRIEHLESALDHRGQFRKSHGFEDSLVFDKDKASLPSIKNQKLTVFLSFRSPYSYIVAQRLSELTHAHKIDFEIKPVLPMAMRGVAVPKRKVLYILRDVRRVADEAGIPFGYAADPLGEAANRCLKVFSLLDQAEDQLEFMRKAGELCWTKGVDLSTDAGLQQLCAAMNIEWSQAAQACKQSNDIGLAYAEENRKSLFATGLWGVPSFQVGDFATWGQDRLWMVEKVLGVNGEAS